MVIVKGKNSSNCNAIVNAKLTLVRQATMTLASFRFLFLQMFYSTNFTRNHYLIERQKLFVYSFCLFIENFDK